MRNLTVAASPGFVASRYFQRLEESMSELFPAIAPAVVEENPTLDDFYIAVRKLNGDHELPGLGFDFGCRIRISVYGVVGLVTACSGYVAMCFELAIRLPNLKG